MKNETTTPMTETTGRDALHSSWGLSYASYLVLPRSMMQSMPDEWQGRMAKLLEEMEERYEWPTNGKKIQVILRGDKGRAVDDEFRDYERGRRFVEPNSPYRKKEAA